MNPGFHRFVRAAAVAAGLALGLGAPAFADQTDAQLQPLFDTLAKAPDAGTATAIEEQIWALWAVSGSDTVDLLFTRALQAMAAQDTDTALKLLDAITVIKPDFAEGWNKRATLHFMREELDLAVADIQRVLQLEPRHFAALSGLGQILEGYGDDARALAAFEAALKIHPHIEGLEEQVRVLRRKVQGNRI